MAAKSVWIGHQIRVPALGTGMARGARGARTRRAAAAAAAFLLLFN
jgi:hypothetical protein